jgi:superfamily II DNA or RNA helicase
MQNSFFTNADKDTLRNKINNILKTDKNIQHLDFLIGYIRLSGLKSIVDSMSKFNSRILVGLKSDDKIYKTIQEKFSKEQISDIEDEYQFIDKIRELMSLNKLQIKIVEEKNVHAKMYIFRDDGQKDHTGKNIQYSGSVIVGSSNLTYNGLEKNYELNVEIQDKRYIKDALELFEDLWENSSDLSKDDIEKYIKPYIKIKKEPSNDIFYQILIEYFDDIIDNKLNLDTTINLFDYQKDAVNSAIVKLNRYNGAILGDVVGLGKTVIAVAILKVLKYRCLIIAPPAIHKQWIDTLDKFNIDKTYYKIVTFDKPSQQNEFEMIIIDESHKLKDSKSNRYTKIEELCKFPFRKKVLLLSATLQNNSPADIANQIYLFQDKNSSTLPQIVSLEKFFNPLIRSFKLMKNEPDKEVVSNTIKDISNKIKNNVLKPLLIRRTRKDIESFDMYKNDIAKFPKINKLKTLDYQLGDLADDFITTIDYLENKIKYGRFRVLNNLNQNGKDKYKIEHPSISDNIFNDNDLSTLAKYGFIKRFESSFGAFRKSLDNAINSLTQFIEDLEDNKLYIGKNSNKILNREISKKEYIFENNKIYYIKIDKQNNKEEKIYLQGLILKKDDFADIKAYQNTLDIDLEYLQKLKNIWDNHTNDPKFNKFLEYLFGQQSNKIVIFTEYSDTLHYLKDRFPAILKSRTLFVTSQNRDDLEDKIMQNFDANSAIQKDNFNILITTDTLAEGVNLHRSDTLLNYDLPWNSTKLMQRMGRINRIGSKFDNLHIANFKPVDQSNNVIKLLEKSFLKLQSFHYTLGEDTKILFDYEEVEAFGINKDLDEELKYLQLVRDFKQKHPNEFELLKRKKTNSLKLNFDISRELAFFKIGNNSYFYQLENHEYKNIDFLTFINQIEGYDKCQYIKTNIDRAINSHIQKLDTEKFTNNDLKNVLTKKDKEARILVKYWYQEDNLIDKELFLNITDLIDSKVTKTLSLNILALQNKEKDIIIKELNKFNIPTQTQSLEQQDIKTKIFISLKGNE